MRCRLSGVVATIVACFGLRMLASYPVNQGEL
jgi:hypothetical protein